KMPFRFQTTRLALATAVMLALATPVSAQSDDADAEMRVQQLENQLRQLTGQNEELQYRNRQLEERLRLLQGGAQGAPASQPAVAQPNVAQPNVAQPSVAAAPPMQPNPPLRQPQLQPGYDQHLAAPAPTVLEAPATGQVRRRGDAFDPAQNPNAPGAPRALGGGQLPIGS